MLSSRVAFTNKSSKNFTENNLQAAKVQPVAICNLSADETKSFCGVSSATLTADAGYSSYKWSTGATSQSISVTSSGTYYFEVVNSSYETVTNGDFESSSNHYNGFTSDYHKNTNNLYSEGDYAVIKNPNSEHSSFATMGDHTSGSGYMMVVNGSSTANVNVWAESIAVLPNTTYQFSVWGASVYSASPGHLAFSINGTQLGNIQLSSSTGVWQNFTTQWASGSSTTANISIVNLNTDPNGNDFALDDVSFAPVCRKTFTVTLNPNPSKPVIAQN